MNFYSGVSNRQVGGGLLASGLRGIRPLLMSLLSKLKPHAISLGKSIGSRALEAVGNVSADLGTNLLKGNLNRKHATEIVKNEAIKVGEDLVKNYKRKLDNQQDGSGSKRRKMSRKIKRSPKKQQGKRVAKGRKSSKRSRRKVINKKRKSNKFKDIFTK